MGGGPNCGNHIQNTMLHMRHTNEQLEKALADLQVLIDQGTARGLFANAVSVVAALNALETVKNEIYGKRLQTDGAARIAAGSQEQ